ncbi:MAG: hypothetical protein NUV80_00600, partial [Candidatus Berkelbacteria bacterium]|nr:hypothetical protein [Candidatus Berkelbacteria bacterium]
MSRIVFNPLSPSKPFDLIEDRWISSFDGLTKVWAEETIGENTVRIDIAGTERFKISATGIEAPFDTAGTAFSLRVTDVGSTSNRLGLYIPMTFSSGTQTKRVRAVDAQVYFTGSAVSSGTGA